VLYALCQTICVSYAGLGLIIAQTLNYVQTGSAAPVMLFCGLGLVGLGLAFLTLTQYAKGQQHTPQSDPRRRGGTDSADDRQASLPTAPLLEGMHVQQDYHPLRQNGVKAGLSTRGAMLVCVVAGIAGAGWSPLSTYARSGQQGTFAEVDPVHDATICLVVFQIGQLCALPSIANIGGWLTGTGVVAPIRNLNLGSAAFGILCGIFVSTGYMAYFTSSVREPAIHI
jgi:hypothetical protein